MESYLTSHLARVPTAMATEKTHKQLYIEGKTTREDIIIFVECFSGTAKELLDQLGFSYIEYSTMLAHPRVFWGELDQARHEYGNRNQTNAPGCQGGIEGSDQTKRDIVAAKGDYQLV